MKTFTDSAIDHQFQRKFLSTRNFDLELKFSASYIAIGIETRALSEKRPWRQSSIPEKRVPLDRIRLEPPPGTATERDVIEIAAREKRLCELVDGVLVEKPMGYLESLLAVCIARMLGKHVDPRILGNVTGEQGMMRIFPGLVRIPDVAFASWDRFPAGRLSPDPILDLTPDLAVEVLSESNTSAEMELKRGEYFDAGVRLVWIVDPQTRTVFVFDSPTRCVTLAAGDVLDGGDIVPGFSLSLADLIAVFDRRL